MMGTSRPQQKMMDERGYITLTHVAAVLRVSYSTASRYYQGQVKHGRLEGVRIGRQIYIRKTSLATMLRNRDPDNAVMIAWLLGIEPTGECKTCALPIPVKNERCSNCVELDSGNKI